LWFALKIKLSSPPHNSHLAVAITAIPGSTLFQVYKPIPIDSMNAHIKLARYIRFSQQEAKPYFDTSLKLNTITMIPNAKLD
jgi:hypothetical protein